MKKAVLLGLLFSLVGFAGEGSKSFSVGAKPKLSVSNISGQIHVIKGVDGRVEVSWTRDDDRIEVVTEQKGDRIEIRAEYPKNTNTKGGVHFEVRCPDQADLEVSSVSGDITVEGIGGHLELQAVSGDIDLSDSEGELEVQTVSGNVKLTQIGDAELAAQVVSGNISYQGNLKGGGYSFNATSGNIHLDLSDDASFEIGGNVMNGKVDIKFPGVTVQKEKYTGFKQVEGKVNGGEVEVEVSTISGSLTIK